MIGSSVQIDSYLLNPQQEKNLSVLNVIPAAVKGCVVFLATLNRRNHEPYSGSYPKELGVKWGTTTIGMTCLEGVLFATDTRVVQGMRFIAHKKGKKIHKVDDHIAMTIAGTVADAQVLVDVLRYQARMFRLERGFRIPVRSLVSLASIFLFRSRLFPMSVQALIGGVDGHGAELHQIDPLGGTTKEDVIATGSGSPLALGFLESSLRKKVRLYDAIPYAVQAILVAMSRDTATGNDFEVAMVDANGYRELSEEERNKVASLLKERK